MSVREVDTPAGPARVTIERPTRAVGTLVLGHGAGGSSWSMDVLAVADAACAAGWAVALVEQPWRVQGKKVAARPPALDAAWVPVVTGLRTGRGRLPGPLVVGGRSAGARVACRTCLDVGAGAVLALSFPLRPPGRPESSRAPELEVPLRAGMPVVVVQGRTDPFGSPAEVRAAVGEGGGRLDVIEVAGTHSLPAGSRAGVVTAATGLLHGLG